MGKALRFLRMFRAELLWGWSAALDTDWNQDAGSGLLGQDDNGDWWFERGDRWVPLDLRRPRHIAALLRSRRRRAVVMLEWGASHD